MGEEWKGDGTPRAEEEESVHASDKVTRAI